MKNRIIKICLLLLSSTVLLSSLKGMEGSSSGTVKRARTSASSSLRRPVKILSLQKLALQKVGDFFLAEDQTEFIQKGLLPYIEKIGSEKLSHQQFAESLFEYIKQHGVNVITAPIKLINPETGYYTDFSEVLKNRLAKKITRGFLHMPFNSQGDTLMHHFATEPGILYNLTHVYPFLFIPNYLDLTPVHSIVVQCLHRSTQEARENSQAVSSSFRSLDPLAGLSLSRITEGTDELIKEEYKIDPAALLLYRDQNTILPAPLKPSALLTYNTLFLVKNSLAVAAYSVGNKVAGDNLQLLRRTGLLMDPEIQSLFFMQDTTLPQALLSRCNIDSFRQEVIKNPTQLNSLYGPFRQTLLQLAVKVDSKADIIQFLLNNGQNIAAQDANLNTLLHLGLGTDAVNYILATNKVNKDILNMLNRDNKTALRCYAEQIEFNPSQQSLKLFKKLIKAGAALQPSGQRLNFTELKQLNLDPLIAIPYIYWVINETNRDIIADRKELARSLNENREHHGMSREAILEKYLDSSAPNYNEVKKTLEDSLDLLEFVSHLLKIKNLNLKEKHPIIIRMCEELMDNYFNPMLFPQYQSL